MTTTTTTTANLSSKVDNKGGSKAHLKAEADLVKMPRGTHPNQIAFDRKLSDIDLKIKVLKERLDDLRLGDEKKGDDRSEKSKLLNELKKIRDEQRVVEDERRRLVKDMTGLKETLKKKTGETSAAKEKLQYKSPVEIERRIKELEQIVEGGRCTLAEEKQIISDISKLRKNKKILENLEGSNSSDNTSIRLRIEQIKAKLGELEPVLDQFKSKSFEIQGKLTVFEGEIAEEREARAKRQELTFKAKNDLDEAYTERRAVIERSKQERQALREAKIKREARQQEEMKKSKIREEIQNLEEQLLARAPETILEKKMSECSNLTAYFQSFVTKESSLNKGKNESESSSFNKSKLDELLQENELIVKKSERVNDILGGNGNQGKESKKKREDKKSIASHLGSFPVHILAALGDLGLSVPSRSDELVVLFESINKLKLAFMEKHEASKGQVDEKRLEIESKIKALNAELESMESSIKKKKAPSNSTHSTTTDKEDSVSSSLNKIENNAD